MRRCITLLFLVGCGFSTQPGAPDAAITPMIDAASVDGPPPPDAAVCAAGVIDVCAMPAPITAFDVLSAMPLNTDSDSRCKPVSVSGHSVCLIYATEVTIMATLTVTGSRPLALVSASTMVVSGAIDASSHGAQTGPAADDPSCGFATSPQNDRGGAGGGAGGGLALAGGDGGIGDTNKSGGGNTAAGGTHGATVPPPALRGGCRGQKGGDELQMGGFVGGDGGHGGGALYLAARQSVSVPGSIRATGAGGAGGQAQSGGGGGGSGGMVVIESASITVGGQISANGGGGGQGGGRLLNGDNVTGFGGSDGGLGTTPAAGGFGANNNDAQFSRGGVGGAGATAAGRGTDSTVGGGGGGGAAGVVHLIGTVAPGGTISPPAS